MSSFAILIIVALIVLALLLVGGGLIFYFMKRGKGTAAEAQASVPGPNQMAVPPAAQPQGPSGFSGGEVPPDGAYPPQQPPQPSPQQSWGAPQEEPQPIPDWKFPGEKADTPSSAYSTNESNPPSSDQEAYVTTPGTNPNPSPNANQPLPNPELFMTTPSAGRKTSLMETKAHLQADDGTVIDLDRLMMRVGRHPECDIVVPTPGASRQHAEFEFRDGAWMVTDLNSGNGTWVNGVRVASHKLAPGDEVRIDQTRFRFGSGE